MRVPVCVCVCVFRSVYHDIYYGLSHWCVLCSCIQGRIAFTSFPQDTTAVAGRTASMVCAAAAGSARVSYTWYYPNNSRIDPSVDSRLMISAGTLNFLSVDFSQRGTYSCRVQVIGSTFLKDASALLTVWGKDGFLNVLCAIVTP